MLKNKYVILASLLFLLLLLRLPVLFTMLPQFWHSRELYNGTIARELIVGPVLPLFDYQPYHYKGGELVSGILTVPFFLLFGQSYVALKLVAVAFSAATLIFWYLFLARFFNRTVAWLAGLLFVISPPLYTKFTLILFGGKHCEANLFTAMAVFIFYQLFFRAEESKAPNKNLYYSLFGLVCGFGMYFDYVFALTIATCFLFWFIFDKRFMLKKSFFTFLVFFFVGLGPWIYYNATHHFKGLCLRDLSPDPSPMIWEIFSSPHAQQKPLDKLFVLLTNRLPHSFNFDDFLGIRGDHISFLYFLVFALSFCALVWLNRKIIAKLMLGIVSFKTRFIPAGNMPREAFLLAYPFVFFALFGISSYATGTVEDHFWGFDGYKRLIVLYPFIFAIIALFLNKLMARKNKLFACLYFLLLGFLILSGLIANYGMIRRDNFGSHTAYEGYHYEVLGKIIVKQYGADTPKILRLAMKFSKQDRPLVYVGIGEYWGGMLRALGPEGLAGCVTRINKVDLKYRHYAYLGLGVYLVGKCEDDFQGLNYFVNRIDEKYRPYIYRALGEELISRFRKDIGKWAQHINLVDKKYRPSCYWGAGDAIGRYFGGDIPQCVGLLEKVDTDYRNYAFQGLGASLLWRYKYFLKKSARGLIEKIPEQYRDSFVNGSGDWDG